jgi:hypothetical protein
MCSFAQREMFLSLSIYMYVWHVLFPEREYACEHIEKKEGERESEKRHIQYYYYGTRNGRTVAKFFN